MKNEVQRTDWSQFLKDYTRRNEGRRTRVGVIQMKGDVADDLWLEDGLPLIAVDVYPNRGQTRIDVVCGSYSHAVEDVERLIVVDGDADNEGLDILDTDGKMTIMRFENWPIPVED